MSSVAPVNEGNLWRGNMSAFQRGYEAAMKGKPAKESGTDFLAGYNEGRRDARTIREAARVANSPRYDDGRGNVVFVSDGISDGKCFFTVKRRRDRLGLHRISSPMLPERTNAADAQQDLAIYASLKGWNQEE